MSVVKRVREVLAGTGQQNDATDDEAASNQRAERTTRLYECRSCGTTYVSTEKETCSQCASPVESVPTEQDLGLL